ncbi:MAG: hypothetical protein AUJ74_07730 [Candidatus Omnitrophica bacterium CG1_02_44_16]|nr:MAG: hypothetical protein AUJ74_07730 [Candidatus Omnitrophica bacterium CG1_02_44_16]PIY81984.1 MAG: hypothetical protein COY78_08995 [Candidatus Omnitrophica bacterium CG_4_10_14_0_8_um_filter_44_12]PIZ84099.1 MAG: hypothetical protein COX96_05570 [Candidatus Omnitrophica bacterium CG_4_10_14_0_2_um_filter_44_9]
MENIPEAYDSWRRWRLEQRRRRREKVEQDKINKRVPRFSLVGLFKAISSFTRPVRKTKE